MQEHEGFDEESSVEESSYEQEQDREPEAEPLGPANNPMPVIRRRGRPRRGGGHPRVSTPEREERNKELAGLDLDEWCARFNWDQPGMKIRLTRIAPPFHNGHPTSGFLEMKANQGYTLGEVKERYGGGDYEVKLIGPRSAEDPRPVPLNRKTFSVQGSPKVDAGTPHSARGGNGSSREERGLVDLVKESMDDLRTSNNESISSMRPVYNDVIKDIRASADDRARAKEEAAMMKADLAQKESEKERSRADLAEKRASEAERGMLERQEMMRKEFEEKIKTATSNSDGLLTTLLPHLNDSAQQQVRDVTQMYISREERLSTMHQTQIQQLNQMHQSQLDAQRMMYQSQLENHKAGAEGNLSLMKQQIQILQAEKDAMALRLEEARREVDKARQDMMAQIVGQKPKDTTSQITEMVALMEAMNGLKDTMGGGGGGDDITDGIDNPLIKGGLKLLNNLAPHVPAVVDAIVSSRQQQQPQMQPVQPYPQQMAMVPVQQRQVRRPPPQQPQAEVEQPMTTQPPKPQLARADVEMAVQFLDAVLAQPNPPSPADMAMSVMSQVPRNVSRAFAARPPEKVLEELDLAGMLVGRISTPDGKAYVIEMLHELKKLNP